MEENILLIDEEFMYNHYHHRYGWVKTETGFDIGLYGNNKPDITFSIPEKLDLMSVGGELDWTITPLYDWQGDWRKQKTFIINAPVQFVSYVLGEYEDHKFVIGDPLKATHILLKIIWNEENPDIPKIAKDLCNVSGVVFYKEGSLDHEHMYAYDYCLLPVQCFIAPDEDVFYDISSRVYSECMMEFGSRYQMPFALKRIYVKARTFEASIKKEEQERIKRIQDEKREQIRKQMLQEEKAKPVKKEPKPEKLPMPEIYALRNSDTSITIAASEKCKADDLFHAAVKYLLDRGYRIHGMRRSANGNSHDVTPEKEYVRIGDGGWFGSDLEKIKRDIEANRYHPDRFEQWDEITEGRLLKWSRLFDNGEGEEFPRIMWVSLSGRRGVTAYRVNMTFIRPNLIEYTEKDYLSERNRYDWKGKYLHLELIEKISGPIL